MSEPAVSLNRMGRTASFDRTALTALLAKQDGVITRGQAARCAVSEAAIRHRVRVGGSWQVLLPGIYLSSTGTPTTGQQQMAAMLYGGPRSVITGQAALAVHGIRACDSAIVDVLVPPERRRQNLAFVRLRRTSAMPRLVFPVRGRPYAPPARALADTVRGLADPAEIRAIVAAGVQRGKVQLWQLAEELDRGPVQGSARLRLALAEVANGVRSAPEADLRRLIIRARLPEPIFNPRLYVHDDYLASSDAWWPDAGVAGEVDSREWHLSPRDWEETLARHARMSAHGIIVLHFTPRRILAEPTAVAREMASAIRAGRSRPALPIKTLAAR